MWMTVVSMDDFMEIVTSFLKAVNKILTHISMKRKTMCSENSINPVLMKATVNHKGNNV